MTPEMKELVERLKQVESSRDPYRGQAGVTTNWNRNPDGPAAATLITNLSSALEEAEGALRSVVEHCSNAGLPNEIVADRVVDRCDETARQALSNIERLKQ